MKILSILPHSIAGRLIVDGLNVGFLKLGVIVKVFDALKDNNDDFLKLFNSFNPDYIFSYDYTSIQFKEENKLEVKTISFFSDKIESPQSGEERKLYFESLKNASNYVFYWDKEDCNSYKNIIPNIFYLSHYINTNIYYNKKTPRIYDIMFAGRLDYGNRLAWFLDILKKFKDKNIAWFAFKKHFESAYKKASIEEKVILKKAYKGFIDSETQMATELNKSKIVINTHSQGNSAINYRTFQAMGCGCTVISDFQTEMKDLLVINKDIICYNSDSELIEKISTCLTNEDLTKNISKNAALIVKNEFDVIEGAKKIIDIIQN